MKSRVGRRLEVEGSRGTVMFDGVVEGTKGRWLGIEWDDPSRGKHDGSHNGVFYFRAKATTSGSFIRETKANFGKSFRRAVNERYRTRLEPEVAAQMHVRGSSDQITAVKLVGNEKIAERQSKIDQLEDVHVSDMRVCGLDDDENEDIGDGFLGDEDFAYPTNCVSLGLAGSLLPSWDDVAEITKPMSRLETLYLDENRLPPPNPAKLQSLLDSFTNLKVITLTKMDLEWSSVAACFPMWPSLEELILSNNSITSTSFSSFPPRLRLLNLDCNPLSNWQSVRTFSQLPYLDTLSLAECQLGDMDDPQEFLAETSAPASLCAAVSGASFFPSLRHLNLRDNAVSSWLTIAALSRVVSLTEFVVLRNPVMKLEDSPETSRQILLVKMSNLSRLNHVYVDAKERRGADIDYYKKYSTAYLEALNEGNDRAAAFRFEHPTYERLVEAFGAPEVVKTEEKPNLLKSSLISISVGVEKEGEVVEVECSSGLVNFDSSFPKVTKKVPASMSVQKVKMMAIKSWKGKRALAARDYHVRVVSDERTFLVENESKEISFYGVGNGDVLMLAKK